jgi:GrpB-like predicted nucleotidyltransferase (UPF0157 family)
MSEKIEIVPYDYDWRDRFRRLGAGLRSVLGSAAGRIDHIGSTAVVGLAAKPIIDIQVSVSGFEPLDVYRVPIEHAGYVFRADNTERTKRYFRESAGEWRTHIHVRRLGSWSEQFALLFRDYLRDNVAEALRYADLKYSLAARYQDDRQGYTEAKGQFIWEVMNRADKWSQDVGWQPGSSDA